MNREKFRKYEDLYRTALLDDCVPFCLKHAQDRAYGGYFQCLDYDGSVICTDKFMWSQNRVAWIFSMLYNNLERKPEWLDMAKLGIDFLKKHGRDENGDWYFALDRKGKPIVQPYNIFSDFFAVMAFAEYSKATGDRESADIAIKTYERIQQRKDNPKGKYNKIITENRNLKNLAFPMININVAGILKSIKPDPVYDMIINEAKEEIMTRFLDRKNRVVLENIALDDTPMFDIYEGRHINPGHGIETMWFIMMVSKQQHDWQTIKDACEAVKWLLDFGWDKEYGGIFYFMDLFGKPHVELCWDMKLEWVHVEALIATIMGYHLTGDLELLQWFEKIHDYTWQHFPDRIWGEWYKYLNREGKVNNRCKSNKWQNFFHLPRALYLVSKICKAIAEGSDF